MGVDLQDDAGGGKTIEDSVSAKFIDDPEHGRAAARYSSSLASGINLLKSLLGSGIISIPLAISSFGLIPGIFFMTCAACLSHFGIVFYLSCAKEIGRMSSASRVASITYPSLTTVVDLCIILNCVGAFLSYILLIGLNISAFIKGMLGISADGGGLFVDPRALIFVLMVLVIAPLSFLKKMDHLKYSSFLGVACVFYLTFLSIFHFASHGISGATKDAVKYWAPFSIESFSRFGIFIFAFTCHSNIFPIYNETRKNSVKSLSVLSGLCLLIALIIYVNFGLFSYLTFADVIKDGSMFSYYPQNSLPFQLARLSYAILLLFSCPLQAIPYRISFDRVVNGEGKRPVLSDNNTYLLSTCLFLVLTFSISMLQPDLTKILCLVGSVTNSTISYIIPSLFFYKLNNLKGKDRNYLGNKMMALSLLAFGICVFCTCSLLSVLSFFR